MRTWATPSDPGSGAAPAAAATTPPTFSASRRAFAERLRRIEKGMTAEQVEAILGRPDNIRTQQDPGGIKTAGTREIWGYGARHHLGFATLASIAMDQQGRVQYLSGTTGVNEPATRLGEAELTRLLSLLAEVGPLDGTGFHPRHVIAAVNALQPLGKESGSAVIREYLSVSLGARWGDDDGLFLVMRALFEIPPAADSGEGRKNDDPHRVVYPGYLRPPALGTPDWSPDDLRQFPRFPLMLIDNVPLLLAAGYSLDGVREDPARHLDELDRDAAWRGEPLKPADDPLGVLTKLAALLPREQQRNQHFQLILMQQFLRLIDTVYRVSLTGLGDSNVPTDRAQASFDAAVAKVRDLKIRWDAQRCCYVRGDGTTLPAEIPPVFQRQVFEPAIPAGRGFRIQVVLERRDPEWLEISIEASAESGELAATFTRVLQLGDPEKVLLDERQPLAPLAKSDWRSGEQTGSSVTYRCKLPAGQRVRIEVTHGDQQSISPAYVP